MSSSSLYAIKFYFSLSTAEDSDASRPYEGTREPINPAVELQLPDKDDSDDEMPTHHVDFDIRQFLHNQCPNYTFLGDEPRQAAMREIYTALGPQDQSAVGFCSRCQNWHQFSVTVRELQEKTADAVWG
jgi:hypothetical protein